ncbi:MAG: malonate decarboxylase subunit epsilon [Legionella sp.]|nr:MAG: malonate decarboxylase subunit epsilon [Legionella sp.]PJD98374.1 MAG: malonate decarboxylase subunit epsilon [Legionella sp.]
MKVLCLFSGQGYQDPALFSLFDDKPSHPLIASWSSLLGTDLQQQPLALKDYHTAPLFIGAYQWCLFHLIAPLLASQSIDLAGYSLGEVIAFLVSCHATTQDTFQVLQARTQLMASMIKKDEYYDLLSITGTPLPNEIKQQCDQHQCFVAIEQSEQHLIVGGKLSDLQALVDELTPCHLKTKFLAIGLPSHTPFYSSQKDQLYPYLAAVGTDRLHYPLWNPLSLKKITSKQEEARLLDKELYTPLPWQKLNQLIKEYHYDLIIDLGPGKVMSHLLSPIETSLCSLSDYKSTNGLLNGLRRLLQ